MKKPLAVFVAAAVAVSWAVTIGIPGPAAAAPLATNALALKEAAPSDVIEVHRRYRRHRDGAIIAGMALGIIGAVIAHQEYKRHRKYYRRHYYYDYYDPYPPCIRRHGRLYCR